MCEYCHQSICPPGCPNADEPKAVYRCSYCGESITVDEWYAEIDGDYYHEECLDNWSTSAWLAKFDINIRKAKEPEPNYDEEVDW